MFINKRLAALSAALALAAAMPAVFAQATARNASGPSHAASAAEPKSGLGKQSQSNNIAAAEPMPSAKELVEKDIQNIESTQLTEAQYARIKRLYMTRERQKAMPYLVAAKPVTRTLPMDLSAGKAPPPLRLSHGMPTTVVFSDVNGQPWIIEKVTLNREAFDDGHDGAGAGQGAAAAPEPTNVMTVEPKGAAVYGSVVVKLKGLPTPVIYVLTAAQDEVDARVDAKVPGHNPDAVGDVVTRSSPTIDTSLTQFLDGVPPKDAKRLHVSGLDDTEAWMVGDSLYVRSDAEALYPAWVSSAKSTTGKSVFRFAGLQNSITLVDGGRAVTVFLEN